MPAAVFGIFQSELGRTAVLTGYLFIASCVFVLGRTARDALFLSHYGDRVGAVLPWMFILYGVVSAIVASGYARIASRIARPWFVGGFAATVAVSFLAVRVVVIQSPPWIFPVFYVWSEIAGNLLLAQFWTIANDLHDPRSAKRLFGVIGMGRIVGVVLCGLGAGSFVATVGTENLLFALAVLSLVVSGFVLWLVRDFSLPVRVPTASAGAGNILAPLKSPYVRSIAIVILLGFVAVNIGDFQFKAAARITHPSRDDLALFMARYYATMGFVGLVLQLFVTRPLLRRFGVAGGLLSLPIGYAAANLVLVAFPSVFATTLVKISDNAVQFSIFEATVQLLYFPLEDREKDGARATLEAAVKPIGYALAGVAVLLLGLIGAPRSLLAISRQSWFVLPLIALWIAVIPVVRRRYVATLERSLQKRHVAVGTAPVFEAASRVALVRSARQDPPKIATFAITQLVEADLDAARSEFAKWCARTEPEVRVAAMDVAPRLDDGTLRPLVEHALNDEDTTVAVAAVHAYAQLHGELCVARLESHIEDSRVAVQEAVMIALLQHGALEGVLRSGSRLELWSNSTDPQLRRKAMEVLGAPGVPGAVRIVKRLLLDEDISVKRAAIGAAVSSGEVLLPEIVAALETPNTLSAATNAVLRIGPASCTLVAARLHDITAPRNLRLHLPRVLGQLATAEAFDALVTHLRDPDEWIRQKVLASASRMHRAGHAPPLPLHKANEEMQRELQALESTLSQYESVRAWMGMILVDRWMAGRLRKALVRVLRLAELSPNGGTRVEPIREAVFDRDPQRRSRAIEVLDDVFTPDISEAFARCLDRFLLIREHPVQVSSGSKPENAQRFVRELWQLPDPFAKVLALDAAQFKNISLTVEDLQEGLRADEPTVRELSALVEVTFQQAGWRERLTPLLKDEDKQVKSYVQYVLETGKTGMNPEDEMYTTLEKVLYLQRISLFAEVDPENLMALARAAEVHRSAKGSTVFRSGERGHALFVVIEGRVQTKTSGGRTQEYAEGEAFGELSVLDGSVRSDDAEVIEDAIILQIAREDFVETLRENGPLAEAVIRVLVQRLRAMRVQ